MAGFEFDEDEGEAVDEADEIGASVAIFAGDPELGDHEEVVVVGAIPVDDGEGFELFFVVVVAVLDFDASFEELVGFLVGAGDRLAAAVAGEFVEGESDCGFGCVGVEFLEGGAEVAFEDDLFAGGATEGAVFSEDFAVGVKGFPAEKLVEDFREGGVF